MMNNDYQEAIRTLNTLLRFDEDAFEGYFLRGIAKYNLDDLLGAEDDFSTAIRLNPVYTQAYTYRAITRSRLGNYDDALQDFREAIELRPDLPGPYYSRGVTRLLNQQFKEAIDDFDKFIRQENKVADAFICRGLSYLHLKDTTRAYENFNTAIRTNRENPNGYNRRGGLHLQQEQYKEAEADFNKAIECDSAYLLSYFNRALVYNATNRPMQALADFDKVIQLDSTNSLTYFNRAMLRTQIGDYNRALEDYDKVALYSPNNVLVYYNRAGVYAQLGEIERAVEDYTSAIKLYPDFANAYIYRGRLRELLRDPQGAKEDRSIAQRKIAEYRSRLNDSTYSIYADTTQRFDRLLSFDSKFAGGSFDRITGHNGGHEEMRLLPLFKFTLMRPDSVPAAKPYHLQRVDDFKKRIGNEYLTLSCRESNIAPDTLVMLDKQYVQELNASNPAWTVLFERAVTQSLIKQYTNSVSTYLVGHRVEPVEPVPLPEPLDDARRDDRLHLVDRQLLPADHDRLGPRQPTEQQFETHVQLRRGGGRPEQGREALPRLRLRLLQPRQPAGPLGQPARGVRGLHQSHLTQPRIRRGLLQPRHHPAVYERHPQGLPRPLESRRTGNHRSLRGAETLRITG